ncbi:NAD(P)/FAD-dependent oxidoreductase [Parvularcula oceani]|uniref:NAD(P)/FAD-dependent oxidoreductase n=1 Tax=Parvularcula oceani TaxID=1247963 RepID=UPI0004E15A42|nr:FAD-dependent oxidoreductase [Parvularcula oceani]
MDPLESGTADLAIIGAGITGCSAAFHLARAGFGVVVLEAGAPGCGSTAHSAGNLHLQIPFAPFRDRPRAWSERFAALIPFYRSAVEAWRSAEALVGPVGFRTIGALLVASTPQEMQVVRRKAGVERAAGLDVELLDADTLYERAPRLRPGLRGAAFTAGEADCDPALALDRFAAAAGAAGAEFRYGEAVASVLPDGKAFRVRTAKSEVRARRVINATGASLCALGHDLPMGGFPIQLQETAPTRPLIGQLIYSASDRLTLKQRADGSVVIGGGWAAKRAADGSVSVDAEAGRANRDLAADLVPEIASLEVARAWAHEVNGNDSWMPVAEEPVAGLLALSAPWLGLTAGPRLGELACDWARGASADRLQEVIGTR